MIKVLIVENNPIEKRFLEYAIKQRKDMEIVEIIENASYAELVCLRKKVDMILMDVCTANGESGLKASKNIKKNFPKTKIVITTSMADYTFIDKADSYNCDGFWYKSDDIKELYDIIDSAIEGKKKFPKESREMMIGIAKVSEFTMQEKNIISYIVNGYTYSEISEKLFISVNTVKYYMKNIYQKTGFRSDKELISEVVYKGFVVPGF